MTTRFPRSLLSIAFTSIFGLAACGGGGGGGDDATVPSSSTSGSGSGNTTTTSTTSTSTTSTSNTVINSSMVTPGVSLAVLEAHDAAGTHANLIQIDSSSFDGPSKRLFADKATAYEIESYEIHSNELIKFERDNDKLHITNWIPRDLQNMLIVANLNGEQYKIMSVNSLKGIQTFTINLPWNYGGAKFQSTTSTKIVDFSTVDTSQVTFAFVPQDDVQKEIAAIDISWTLTFPDRVMLGDTDVCRDASVVWRPTRPQDARYLLSFMVNSAQTVAHPKFEEFWNKTAFINWDASIDEQYRLTQTEFDSYSAKEKTQYSSADLAAGKYYNKAHRQMIYQKYTQKHFALGMTGGGGLGGGATLGLNHTPIFELAWTYDQSAVDTFNRDDWFFQEGDRSFDAAPWAIMGHEGGHTLGFGHNASYTVRDLNSHVAVGTIVYSWLAANNKLIVNKETMVGRDESWEQPYNKDAAGPQRSRPRCGDAFEWGGAWERHDIQLPLKNSAEWVAYLEAHKNGTGLDYLRSLLP